VRRRVAAAVVAVLLAVVPPLAAEPVEIRTRTISRFDSGERPSRVGFLGGLVLSGPRGFGGFSGLLADGDRLLAIGDVGTWLSARLIVEGDRPVGLADAALSRRRDRDGTLIDAKRRGDAEAIVARDGAVLVLVESGVELLSYPANGLAIDEDATPTAVALPPAALAGGRRNGVEAMLDTPSGLVVFAEGKERTGDTIPAWRVTGKPATFAVARNGPWSITDAALLPGGDAILLERRWEGGFEVGMRLRRLGRDALATARGVVDGPVLLEADFSAEIDNMEGLAAEVRDGRIVLTAMSDDNLSWMQRTLLLRFAVTDPLPRPKPALAG
jgi:hypothetical protein